MAETTEVVVIGGGYAGVMAANRLSGREDVAVTLINPRPVFVERIRLHQLAGGSDDAVLPFPAVLAPKVRLVVDSATRIEAPRRQVVLASGRTIAYDRLVYAVGSVAADDVHGVAQHAHPVATLEDTVGLRAALEGSPESRVTVVGAGPAGIETAAELAEAGRSVTLVCGGPLGPYLHPRGRRAVQRRLDALGVRVLAGPGTVVTAVTADGVRLEDGSRVIGVTAWAAGFRASDLAARSGLPTDEAGRLLTDETLTARSDDRIVAAGDVAAPSGLPYRMGCQSAVQLGPQAAETVLARIDGRPPKPVAVAFAGQCISLGRRTAIFQFARRDDRPVPLTLGGRAGAGLKELICRATAWQLGFEARRPGLLDGWLPDGSRADRILRAEAPRPTAAGSDTPGGVTAEPSGKRVGA